MIQDASDERVRAKWLDFHGVATMGGVVFLTLSGLFVYLGAFSTLTQVMVLVHTVLGLVFLVPYAVYQTRHLKEHLRWALEVVLLLGWLSGLALAVSVVSGLVVTWQAAMSYRISPGWRETHVVSSLSLIGLLGFHLALAAQRVAARQVFREPGSFRGWMVTYGARCAGVALAGMLATLGWRASYRPPPIENFELPRDYSYKYGPNPFAPSLARTSDDKPLHPKKLAGSKSCGTAGCHEEIYKEWQVSAHRWAAASPSFQAVQKVMAKNEGPESTRYCAGCHDPISLYSGSKNIYSEDLTSLGADEGVSCVSCHSLLKTDVKGNAAYVIGPHERYMYELGDGKLAKAVSDFLIRAMPKHHVGAYDRPLYKSPEYCGACHKQFINQEINHFGWVQLQNQYDNWRTSHWNTATDPKMKITCRECHMPLQASRDPAAGDARDEYRTTGDGKHRSHRFLGGNQMHPRMLARRLNIEGAEEQCRLTEQWLRGEYPIPEIAHKWRAGPAVPIQILAPPTAKAGEPLRVQVVATSNKVGHDFPTGPLDIIQAWIELVVTDRDGHVIYHSGRVRENGFIDEGAFIFKAEGIDREGNLIDRHNLWEMVGVRFKRALFPGFSDQANYEIAVGAEVAGPLAIAARLRYRKMDQFLFNNIAQAGLADLGGMTTSPITDISTARAQVAIERQEKRRGD